MSHQRRSPAPIALLLCLVLLLVPALAACGDDDPTADPGAGTDAGGGDAGDGGDGAAGAAEGSGTGPTIAGTWRLTSLSVGGEGVDVPEPPPTITVEQGTISGSGGCNQFSGTIDRADDGGLSIANLASTEMACDLLDFETTYLPALGSADAWSASPDGITFTGPDVAAVYAPVAPEAPAPLTGTTWVLDTVYSGESGPNRTASSTDPSDEPARLVIDGDSATVTGACDDVALTVTHEDGVGGNFAVEQADATGSAADQGCEATDGVGVNQRAALDGLQNATGYMIDGQRLVFIGLEGETVGFRAEG